jgi:hypothetical protein
LSVPRRLALATWFVLAAAPVRAETTAGVVATGEAAPMAVELATARLAAQGYRVVELPAETIGQLDDCFLMEDASCAATVVNRSAVARVLFVATYAPRSGEVTIKARWLVKGEPVIERTAVCKCAGGNHRPELEKLLAQVVPRAPAETAPARAIRTRPVPPTSASGLAAGIEVGEPSSGTVGWFTRRLGVAVAIGTGTLEGPGVSMHADLQLTLARLSPGVPLYAGVGARYYHHGYRAMSIDEIPDTHVGVRGTVGLGLERGRFRIYAELAPGVDLARTSSCTLASGARSVCPHAQDAPVFAQLVVGARWFVAP